MLMKFTKILKKTISYSNEFQFGINLKNKNQHARSTICLPLVTHNMYDYGFYY
jgi:hypothetical protein